MSRLLELLLEYREVMHEDDPSNRMTCIVNLLVINISHKQQS